MTTIKQEGRLSVHSNSQKASGNGLVNTLINKLPFELHLPGYQYCGPGTRLSQRLSRGDPGINPLDAACKTHDIAYDKQKNLSERHKSDYELEQKAWKRVKSKNSSFGEKSSAWIVTAGMKLKRKLGMGCKSISVKRRKVTSRKKIKKIEFGSGVLRNIRKALKTQKKIKNNIQKTAEMAIAIARKSLKASGGKKKIKIPRIIPIPKQGGILPLIPIFAGLSALGSLAGGAAGIARAINAVKNAKEKVHNKNIEAISVGKTGHGLYLKPYRNGLGLYLKPYKNSKNF